MADELVGRAFWELSASNDQLDRDLKAGEQRVRGSGDKAAKEYEGAWAKGTGRVKEHIGSVGKALAAVGIGIGIATVTTFFASTINAASDLNEEVSKAGVVFGQASDKVEAFGKTAAEALGQSERQALAAAGGFGNMFRTIGFAEDAAADMSIRMVQLASDMASFNNQDPSAMLERLRSGLSGEAEPLRQFGVLISEARVKTEAYESGLAAVGAELTEQEKVVARYQLILKDTALQQGDFARTSTGLANSQRIFAAEWEDAQARIGAALLPVAIELVHMATDVVPSLVTAFETFISAVGPLLGFLRDLAGLWLEHSAKLLPALVVMLGVRLVGALEGATIRMKLLDLSAKALRITLLLGLPVLFEVGDALQKLTLGLRLGDTAMTHFDRVLAASRGNQNETAVVLDQLTKRSTELGVPLGHLVARYETLRGRGLEWNEALERIETTTAKGVDHTREEAARYVSYLEDMATAAEEASDETAIAWDRMLDTLGPQMRHKIEDAILVVRTVPGGIAATLRDGQTIVGTDAADLAGKITDAFRQSKEDSLAEAAALLKGLLNLFTETEFVEQIEEQLERNATAWSDYGRAVTSLATLASADTRAGLASEDIGVRADTIARVNEILAQYQLIPANVRASAEAANPEMVAGFQSNFELVSAELRRMNSMEDATLREMIPVFRAAGQDAIADHAEGILHNRTLATYAAGRVRNETLAEFEDRTNWAYRSGSTISRRFAEGLMSNYQLIADNSITLADAAASGLQHRSPAKVGPFMQDPAIWSEFWVGRWRMPWLRAIPLVSQDSLALAHAAAGPLMGGGARVSPDAVYYGPGGAGYDAERWGGGGQQLHVHLHTTGNPPGIDSEPALGRAVRRVIGLSAWDGFGG